MDTSGVAQPIFAISKVRYCGIYIHDVYVSIIVPNATMVVYRILFGGMHPLPFVGKEDRGIKPLPAKV